jgi:hypothetical protein
MTTQLPLPGNDVTLRHGRRSEHYTWLPAEGCWVDAEGRWWWSCDWVFLIGCLRSKRQRRRATR